MAKGKITRAFVGAMKIARPLPVSERHIEWHAPIPAPSLRELSSECETEGVSPGERNRSKISEPMGPHGKPMAQSNQRTTLPQLRCAQQLPQRGSRGRLYHSPDYSLKTNAAGDFHRPYETQEFLHFTIHPTAFQNHTVSGGGACNHRDDLKLILDILTKTVILILDMKTGAPKG